MLTIGIVLLIIGALVALASGGRDDAVRLFGLAAAAVGLVLILLAVLPENAHGAAGAVMFPFWRLRLRRRRQRLQIDPEFARVLAAQVAIGIAQAPADPYFGAPYVVQQERRMAHAALGAIGIMLLQACKDDPVVQATLRTDVEIDERPGVTTLRMAG